MRKPKLRLGVRELVRQGAKRWRRVDWPEAALLVAAVAVTVDQLNHIAERIHYLAFNFDGVAIDGAFQVFNPLRRLAAGQTPGGDFQFFHGLGTLLVHYPLFALFGGDLHASELSREVMSPLLYVLTAAVLLQTATRRWRVTLVGTALMLVLIPAISVLIVPAGSLLGVRSAVPLLVGAAIIYHRRSRPGRPELIARGVVLVLVSLAFVMSVEHGLATIAAFVLVSLGLREQPWRQTLVRLGQDLGVIFCLILLSFACISGLHLLQPIKYALVELPGDQFWYFGTPPNSSLLSLRDVLENKLMIVEWYVAALLMVVIWRNRRPEYRPVRLGFIFLLIYGLISTFAAFGIKIPAYLQPLLRIEFLVVIVTGYLMWRERDWSRSARAWAAAGVIGGLALLMLVLGLPGAYPMPDSHAPKISGTRMSASWQEYLRVMTATVPHSATLWQAYSNVFDAQRGSFNPSGYDYIIHALGPERRAAYVQKFEQAKPDYVTTPRRAYTKYEEWLEMMHWDWYEQVFINYDHVATTPFSNVWKKHSGWKRQPDGGWLAEVKHPSQDLLLDKLPADLSDQSVVTVEVKYRATNKLGFVPLFGKMARYFVGAYDSANTIPASLPPYRSTWQFPVVTAAGKTPRLHFYTGEPIPGAHLEIESVRYRVLDLDKDTRNFIMDVPADPVI
jgi:hypothetical protein